MRITLLISVALVAACGLSQATVGVDGLRCECACDPMVLTVVEKTSMAPVSDVSVSVMHRDQEGWSLVQTCVERPSGEEPAAASDDRPASFECRLDPVAGLYQFTASAPGYQTIEERLVLGQPSEGFEVCDCSCAGMGPLQLQLNPLAEEE